MTLKEVKFIKQVYDYILNDNSKLTNKDIKKAYNLIFSDNADEEQEISTIIRWIHYDYDEALRLTQKTEDDLFKIKQLKVKK